MNETDTESISQLQLDINNLNETIRYKNSQIVQIKSRCTSERAKKLIKTVSDLNNHSQCLTMRIPNIGISMKVDIIINDWYELLDFSMDYVSLYITDICTTDSYAKTQFLADCLELLDDQGILCEYITDQYSSFGEEIRHIIENSSVFKKWEKAAELYCDLTDNERTYFENNVS